MARGGGGPSRRPAAAQLRARQNVLLENAQKTYFTPVEFQVELVAEAVNSKKGNRVVFIGGQDKAFFIVTLVKEVAIKTRPITKASPKMLIVCICNEDLSTICRWIEDYTDLPSFIFEGTNKTTNCSEVELNLSAVVFCLAADLANLPKNLCFSIVIFDKCDSVLDWNDKIKGGHDAANNDASVPKGPVIQFISDHSSAHIVGLTSALTGVGSADLARLRINRLESSFNALSAVSNELTVLSKYGPKPKERVLEYGIYYDDRRPEYNMVLNLIEQCLDFLELFIKAKGQHSEVIQEAMRYPMELAYVFLTLGPWCAAEAAHEFLLEVSRSIDSLEWLKDIQISRTTLQITHTFLQQVHVLCNSLVSQVLYDPACQDAGHTDKLVTLLDAIQQYTEPKLTPAQPSAEDGKRAPRPHYVPWHEDPTALCGLIIVRHRITALVLNRWLQTVAKTLPKFAFVKSNFIIGQTTLDGDDPELVAAGLSRQEEVLQKFRYREYNLLITTTATEDTLELPHCNLVVRFDPPESYKSYIVCKAKAKASSKCAQFFIMLSQYETAKFTHLFSDYRKMEQLMLEKSHLDDITIDGDEGDTSSENCKSYRPSESKDCLIATLSNAIPLVNRYCARLPSDTLTKLAPVFEISCPGRGFFECSLRLPINSALKEPIRGDSMRTPVLAKQAVALKAIEMLHKAGDIDNHLSFLGKDTLKPLPEDQIVVIDEVVPQGAPRPGTTKRRQYYHKDVAQSLRADLTVVGWHLYKISMSLICPIPEEQNARARAIFDPANSALGFGLITCSKLAKLCPFPIYTRSGEVLVQIEEICDFLKISEQQREMAEFFHMYTFRDVLRLEKFPMRFDLKVADCGFLIIPINKDVIQWNFISQIYSLRNMQLQKVEEDVRKNFVFDPKVFADAVVMPWYRNIDKPQFFYVAQICEDLSPMSGFPDSSFDSFNAYYFHKYNINICNKSQPLLDVDHTSARLNLLTPRYVNRKGVTLPASSEETRKAKRENLQQKQILVPELCLVHPFSASLWRKAVCLPCILYRINHLLLADEIRVTVAREICVGQVEIPHAFKWDALNFGWTLLEVLEDAAANKKTNKNSPVRPPISEEKIAEIRKPFVGGLRKEGVELTPSGQLVIDMFDPSKVTIPNDEELLEAELRSVEFPSPRFDWKPIPGIDEPRIRVGSPSNFEGEQEWDMEYETDFVSIDMPGLGYISAPGMFNINGLSEALAKQRDEDIYDSADEDSLLEDMQNPDEIPLFEGNNLIDGKEDVEHNSLWLSPCSNPQQKKVLEGVYSDVAFVCDDLLGLQIQVCRNGRMGVNFREFPFIKKALAYMEAASEFDAEDQTGLIEDQCVGNEVVFGELLQDRDEAKNETFKDTNVRINFDGDIGENYGPSPAIILQALTMSNANDGLNLERLETVGDSFLKYAVTNYLYCAYPNVYEGKLSFLRSKYISNVNLYRLGRKKCLGGRMIGTKFDPADNWLPPGFCIPEGLEKSFLDAGMLNNHCNLGQFKENENADNETEDEYVPYSLLTHHSIPDKSLADCVEALIGAYLVSCGRRATLEFMTWMGIRVRPLKETELIDESSEKSSIDWSPFIVGKTNAPVFAPETKVLEMKEDLTTLFGLPPSPLASTYDVALLNRLLSGHQTFEEKIGYKFKNKGLLLQAFTHASYTYNTLTDCYQRLEFLGDAVLDYLITRYLYEDPAAHHSPGALTDLRSALVNNTFFAALAVKYEFHKYFLCLSPRLFSLIHRFVDTKKHLTGRQYFEKYYLGEDECEEAEEIEVPKALGDIFESLAGAIYLDSGFSLNAVWHVYYAMMAPEIAYFSKHVPKSPIRELLELEPQTAKFERAKQTLNGKIRVRVEVFGKGTFVGIGRNKRIAKCTAAKRALRVIKGPVASSGKR